MTGEDRFILIILSSIKGIKDKNNLAHLNYSFYGLDTMSKQEMPCAMYGNSGREIVPVYY